MTSFFPKTDVDRDWVARVEKMPHHQREDELISAARIGNAERARYLMDKADVRPDARGGLAFMAACNRGHAATASIFLDRGMDVNASNGRPFIMACENGHTDVVTLLLKHGVDTARDNARGITCAAESGHVPVLRALHAAGIDLRRDDDMVLRAAVARGRIQAAKFLLGTVGADANAKFGENLRHAVQDKNYPMITLLLDNGATVTACGGQTFVDQVRLRQSKPIAALLTERLQAEKDAQARIVEDTARKMFKDIYGDAPCDLKTLRTVDARANMSGLQLAAMAGHLPRILAHAADTRQAVILADFTFTTPQVRLSTLAILESRGEMECVFAPKLWIGRTDMFTRVWDCLTPAQKAGRDRLKILAAIQRESLGEHLPRGRFAPPRRKP